MAFQHAVTINEEQERFLRENPRLSLSKVTQQGLNALMNDYNKTDLKGLLDIERGKAARIAETMGKMRDFIESKGLMPQFFDNEAKNEGNNTIK